GPHAADRRSRRTGWATGSTTSQKWGAEGRANFACAAMRRGGGGNDWGGVKRGGPGRVLAGEPPQEDTRGGSREAPAPAPRKVRAGRGGGPSPRAHGRAFPAPRAR